MFHIQPPFRRRTARRCSFIAFYTLHMAQVCDVVDDKHTASALAKERIELQYELVFTQSVLQDTRRKRVWSCHFLKWHFYFYSNIQARLAVFLFLFFKPVGVPRHQSQWPETFVGSGRIKECEYCKDRFVNRCRLVILGTGHAQCDCEIGGFYRERWGSVKRYADTMQFLMKFKRARNFRMGIG